MYDIIQLVCLAFTVSEMKDGHFYFLRGKETVLKEGSDDCEDCCL